MKELKEEKSKEELKEQENQEERKTQGLTWEQFI